MDTDHHSLVYVPLFVRVLCLSYIVGFGLREQLSGRHYSSFGHDNRERNEERTRSVRKGAECMAVKLRW